MAVVRRDLVHHRFLRPPHHVQQSPIAEPEVGRPRRRVLAQAIVAAGEGVAHVRRLSVEGVVAAGAVADLQAAVGVTDRGGVRIELQGTQAEVLPVAVDHPQHLRAEGHARLVGGAVALRERRAERDRQGEQSQQ